MKRSSAELIGHHRTQLSEEEAALYDRQIRLWGVAVQQRMRDAKILLAGLGGIMNEVCKNLVLAGVGSVFILDNQIVYPHHLAAQFFLSETFGENRVAVAIEKIRELNPKVNVDFEVVNISQKNEDFLSQFDIICLSNSDLQTMINVNRISRKYKIPLFITDSFGYFAYMFNDLNGHQYVPVSNPPPKETTWQNKKAQANNEGSSRESPTKKQKIETQMLEIKSSSFADILTSCESGDISKDLPEMFYAIVIMYEWRSKHSNLGYPNTEKEQESLLHVKSELEKKCGFSILSDEALTVFARSAAAELSPVCAIVGGVIGQEIIKVLSGKEEPIYNFFFYDGMNGKGLVEDVAYVPKTAISSAPVNTQQHTVILDD